ncbi:MAG: hypothetical protein WA294_14760 [Acidobacteriaceae bacterium]
MSRSSAAGSRPDTRHSGGRTSASPQERPAPAASEQEDKASAHTGASVHPAEPADEPEDAQITGTSRSLQRRVLGLNVNDHHAGEEHPDTPAGQHATGSFTEKESRRK